MASVLDKITDVRNAARPNSARATGTRSSGGPSLACDNLTGWPTASKVHFVTYTIDSNSNPVAGTQLDCYGIVSGNNINSFTVVDGTDNGNSVGDVVEMLPTAAWGQDLADALMTSHDRDGSLKDGAVDSASILASDVVTTAKILNLSVTTAKINDASITNAKLSTTAGEIGGAWQSWSPTWTNVTVGNGTLTAKYSQVGKTIRFRLVLVAGTSTSFSGTVSFTNPVTAASYGSALTPIGSFEIEDAGVANYVGYIQLASTTGLAPLVFAVGGTYGGWAPVTNTVPYNSFGTGDTFSCSGQYEAA